MVYECTLSKELQEQAERELNEDPKRRDQDIEHIRKWIKKQPHLKKIRTDDFFILRFLRGCKFSLERTKEKIELHFTLKTALPDWFRNRDPENPKIRELLKKGMILILKEKDDQGRLVFIFRQGVFDPSGYSADDIMKAMYILIDVFYEMDEIHQITGVIAMMDMKGMTMAHALFYPVSLMKKSTVLWQEGYCARNKGIHYINVPSAFETMFNLFKSFLNEKTRSRLTLYGENYDEVYKIIPKRILPKEFGGESETVEENIQRWLALVDSKRKWLLEDEKCLVDESKRPGKPKSDTDLFGIEGSFRKLNVD